MWTPRRRERRRNSSRHEREMTQRARHTKGPQREASTHCLLDGAGAEIGHVVETDEELAFGHLEPTVLLHRTTETDAPPPHASQSERTGSLTEAGREDGMQ